MVGQKHNTQYLKRMRGLDFSYGSMQRCTSMRITKYPSPVVCHDGKEICPAITKPSLIVRHIYDLINGAIYRTLPLKIRGFVVRDYTALLI